MVVLHHHLQLSLPRLAQVVIGFTEVGSFILNIHCWYDMSESSGYIPLRSGPFYIVNRRLGVHLTAENCRVPLLYPQWIVLADCYSGKIVDSQTGSRLQLLSLAQSSVPDGAPEGGPVRLLVGVDGEDA